MCLFPRMIGGTSIARHLSKILTTCYPGDYFWERFRTPRPKWKSATVLASFATVIANAAIECCGCASLSSASLATSPPMGHECTHGFNPKIALVPSKSRCNQKDSSRVGSTISLANYFTSSERRILPKASRQLLRRSFYFLLEYLLLIYKK